MATPAPALLPALAVGGCAQGAALPQGLPDCGWKPRNSIVRDALQVGSYILSASKELLPFDAMSCFRSAACSPVSGKLNVVACMLRCRT